MPNVPRCGRAVVVPAVSVDHRATSPPSASNAEGSKTNSIEPAPIAKPPRLPNAVRRPEGAPFGFLNSSEVGDALPGRPLSAGGSSYAGRSFHHAREARRYLVWLGASVVVLFAICVGIAVLIGRTRHPTVDGGPRAPDRSQSDGLAAPEPRARERTMELITSAFAGGDTRSSNEQLNAAMQSVVGAAVAWDFEIDETDAHAASFPTSLIVIPETRDPSTSGPGLNTWEIHLYANGKEIERDSGGRVALHPGLKLAPGAVHKAEKGRSSDRLRPSERGAPSGQLSRSSDYSQYRRMSVRCGVQPTVRRCPPHKHTNSRSWNWEAGRVICRA